MSQAAARPDPAGFLGRWRRYFAERFPPLQHGALIAAFAFGMQAYAAKVATPGLAPAAPAFLVAFVSGFLIVLQLRILDEFKDAEDDARWRPYRPVPRGLVTLDGLRNLWIVAAAVEAIGARWLAPPLLWGLLAIWLYSGLMGVEFFVRTWLKAHPLTYMASHVVIVPMIAAYLAACHLSPLGRSVDPRELGWPLAASYLAFCVVEVGRKLRGPADEEEGVETYSRLWGRRGAVAAWLGFMAASGLLGTLAAANIGAAAWVAGAFGAILVVAAFAGASFLRDPHQGAGTRFNALSGLWTLALFLGLGVAAMV